MVASIRHAIVQAPQWRQGTAGLPMPTISWFFGISIRMFFNDHAPPHFHAFYGRYEAKVAIETGEIIGGSLPTSQRRLVTEWVLRYREQLLAAWALVRAEQSPERIPGLGADD